VQWLREGECNTKFFHRTVIQRWHSNKITHLISDDGDTIHSHEDMENTLTGYFQNLVTEPRADRQEAINKLTWHVPSIVTPEKNDALLWPITIEEVDQALQETPKGKAPGPRRIHKRLFPSLLAADQNRSLGNFRRLPSHWPDSPGFQCHFLNLSSQRGAGTSSQAVQVDSFVQRHL
jgi:hypothetical protein